MDKTLLHFVAKRFLLIFSICFVSLSITEYSEIGAITSSIFIEPAIWAFIAAAVSSAIAGYWSYTKHCKMVYKEDEESC